MKNGFEKWQGDPRGVVRFFSREMMVSLAKMGMVGRGETGSMKRGWEVEFRVLGGCRWRQAQVPLCLSSAALVEVIPLPEWRKGKEKVVWGWGCLEV